MGQSGLEDHGDGGGRPSKLLVRLTGTTMRRVPVPGPAGGELRDVTATSPADAWAVGYTGGYSGGSPLLLHWNGTAWTRWRLPAGLHDDTFTAVTATSATDAWAVTYGARGSRAAIVRWNGRRWSQVARPDIGLPYALTDVAATSASDVWAVGSAPSDTYKALILHWNGRRWSCARVLQVSPPRFPDLALTAVSASAPDNALAVGSFFDSAHRALTLHWDGHAWTQVMTPQPGPVNYLADVTVLPHSGTFWALDGQDSKDRLLRWTGTAWR